MEALSLELCATSKFASGVSNDGATDFLPYMLLKCTGKKVFSIKASPDAPQITRLVSCINIFASPLIYGDLAANLPREDIKNEFPSISSAWNYPMCSIIDRITFQSCPGDWNYPLEAPVHYDRPRHPSILWAGAPTSSNTHANTRRPPKTKIHDYFEQNEEIIVIIAAVKYQEIHHIFS
ncbi:hypothetical protein B0O80DRAFT_497566 [Mortierella sp. GBAus27b]|nr:hypothetical protein B0O80DRAFT_497566 [Mortierella sp. GBAus27b]